MPGPTQDREKRRKKLQWFLLPYRYILAEDLVSLMPIWHKWKYFRSENPYSLIVNSSCVVDILWSDFLFLNEPVRKHRLLYMMSKYLRLSFTQDLVMTMFSSDSVLFWLVIEEYRDSIPEGTMSRKEAFRSIGQLEAEKHTPSISILSNHQKIK